MDVHCDLHFVPVIFDAEVLTEPAKMISGQLNACVIDLREIRLRMFRQLLQIFLNGSLYHNHLKTSRFCTSENINSRLIRFGVAESFSFEVIVNGGGALIKSP